MASIGGYTLKRLSGVLIPQGERGEDITRPGVDGIAIRTFGERAPMTTHDSISTHTSESAADTAISNYVALQETLVTVVDEAGRTHSNVRVVSFTPLRKKYVATATDGSSWWVFGRWQLQKTS